MADRLHRDDREFLRQMESLAERRIRESMERGEFDDLPGEGEPLPYAGIPYDEMWWVRKLIACERPRRSGT